MQGRSRLPGGASFQHFADEHERGDDDHRFVVDVGSQPVTREHGWGDGGDSRIEKGGPGSDCYERVHVGRVVSEGGPRAGIEATTSPRHDTQRDGEQPIRQDAGGNREDPWKPPCHPRRQRLHHPAHDRIGGQCHAAIRRAGHHERHGEHHGYGACNRSHDRAEPESPVRGRVLPLLCLEIVSCRPTGDREIRAVACGANRFYEHRWRGDSRVVRDARRFGDQVDKCVVHARLVGKRVLHVGLARRARHALDRQCHDLGR